MERMRPLVQRAMTRPGAGRAAAVALLLAIAQLASATHLLFVRHTICPLDGELVHPDEAGGHNDAHVRDSGEPRVVASEGPEAHHGHEHCILASHRRDRMPLHDRVVELRTPERAILATLSPDAEPTAARLALHRLAPKQSPPA
jgi:hypothetical protein